MEKWPFSDQSHGLPPWKNVNFSTFWISSFYSLERRFFVSEYHKRHFLGLNCLKKKVRKMAIFGPKPWVNPIWKMTIFFNFWTSCFYSLNRRFYVLKYHKKTFSWPFFPWKKKVGKMAIFEAKPFGNPFGKMSIFRYFELLVFTA